MNWAIEQQQAKTIERENEWYITKYQWTEWAQQKKFHSWIIEGWYVTSLLPIASIVNTFKTSNGNWNNRWSLPSKSKRKQRIEHCYAVTIDNNNNIQSSNFATRLLFAKVISFSSCLLRQCFSNSGFSSVFLLFVNSTKWRHFNIILAIDSKEFLSQRLSISCHFRPSWYSILSGWKPIAPIFFSRNEHLIEYYYVETPYGHVI